MGTQAFFVENTSMSATGFESMCNDLFNFLYDLTPVDTGYCRDQLDMFWSSNECTYLWNCVYASYLDNGWSNQAPDGMTGPGESWIQSHKNGYA